MKAGVPHAHSQALCRTDLASVCGLPGKHAEAFFLEGSRKLRRGHPFPDTSRLQSPMLREAEGAGLLVPWRSPDGQLLGPLRRPAPAVQGDTGAWGMVPEGGAQQG